MAGLFRSLPTPTFGSGTGNYISGVVPPCLWCIVELDHVCTLRTWTTSPIVPDLLGIIKDMRVMLNFIFFVDNALIVMVDDFELLRLLDSITHCD